MTERWRLLVQQGSDALLQGRFRASERLAAEAARLAPAEPAPRLLEVLAWREQGRPAEAEVMLRGVLAEHPAVDEGQALLGAVLADLGRDGEARRQLDGVDRSNPGLSAVALAAETAAALGSAWHAEHLEGRLAGQRGAVAGCHGALARHLGLVCHVLGRWDEAEGHFETALEANRAAGAPVLVAHTRRHYAALLRARGDDGDWEKAIDLLAEAAAIYRRLGIERLAEDADVVLRRSQDPPTSDERGGDPDVFARTAGGWELAFAGQRAVVADLTGLGHIAALLAAEGRPVHAVDLVGRDVSDQLVGEYRARLDDIHEQVSSADPLSAGLARAEGDLLCAELAEVTTTPTSAPAEVADRARRLVALRIRTSLDELDRALPALARHLRRSIRTGTFCLYEPARPERWKLRR